MSARSRTLHVSNLSEALIGLKDGFHERVKELGDEVATRSAALQRSIVQITMLDDEEETVEQRLRTQIRDLKASARTASNGRAEEIRVACDTAVQPVLVRVQEAKDALLVCAEERTDLQDALEEQATETLDGADALAAQALVLAQAQADDGEDHEGPRVCNPAISP